MKDNTIIVSGKSGGISEESIRMLNEANARLVEDMKRQQAEGTLEFVIMNPHPSLLPELEYIGDGKYRYIGDKKK